MLCQSRLYCWVNWYRKDELDHTHYCNLEPHDDTIRHADGLTSWTTEESDESE